MDAFTAIAIGWPVAAVLFVIVWAKLCNRWSRRRPLDRR